MKKLLAIVVLGLLWSTSGNADHYYGHKPGTGFLDSMKPHLDSIQRSKNRSRSIDNQNRIYELEERQYELERELAKERIINFCQGKYSSNKKKFNRCKCGSYEKSDIGLKCKDGWRERNRIASKKEKEVDWRKKCSLYAVIKYGKQNCIEKK